MPIHVENHRIEQKNYDRCWEGRMKTRLVSFIVLGGLAVTGCVSTGTHRQTLNELEKVRQEQVALNNKFQASERKSADLQQALDRAIQNRATVEAARRHLETQLKSVQLQLQAANQNQVAIESAKRELEEQLKNLQRHPQATAESGTGKSPPGMPDNQAGQGQQAPFKITLPAHLLFDSGHTQITPAGRAMLAEITNRLKQDTDSQIRVEGHTDNRPIKPPLQKRFQTNWELSVARATSIVRYLLDEAGIEPTRLSAVGYADTHPVADNDTEEGRQQNRRIEIVLYPKSPTEPGTQPAKE
jgi:chemotaxis protein MotB